MGLSEGLILKIGEVDDWAVGFASRLSAGETLTGTPQVSVHERTDPEGVYAGITTSQVQRNSAEVQQTDDDGNVIATYQANEAVLFRIEAAADAVAGKYQLRVECETSSGRSPVETSMITLGGPPEPA